ncbi:ABC transporter ATP-binding protein [Jiella pelagia]|uniref:ATP-binding cassette domain-containing protein n=1 Tax=Jiella pelagia TaxID=2986949 RepID=A0ABY7C430_9HYPH|nr:ATP-binding cassette domain-containing protein [Jiella pelagia]WAP70367.1 ATP-binding cassette domain-containing protein [Jiella pelagia]
MKPIIQLLNVRRSYDRPDDRDSSTRHVVLGGINLTITPGSFTVIRGESGSGKTTLLRILGMMDSEYEGVYEFGGIDVREKADWWLDELRSNNVGFIFQDGQLLPHLSLRANAELPLRIRAKSRRERENSRGAIESAAPDFFDPKEEIASGVLDKQPKQVSGGQKQRASVMRAMAHKPSLILADEPTASLDESRKKEILETLRDLTARGHTVVVVSHDKIFETVGRQLEMTDGRLVERAAGPTVRTIPLAVVAPTEGRTLLYGWRPRSGLEFLARQAFRETLQRPIFMFLVLVALIAGVTQISVFQSIITGSEPHRRSGSNVGVTPQQNRISAQT